MCPLLEKYGTFIARCNALIEKVSSFRVLLDAGAETTLRTSLGADALQSCDAAIKDEVRALFDAAGPADGRAKAWSAARAPPADRLQSARSFSGSESSIEQQEILTVDDEMASGFVEALVRLHLTADDRDLLAEELITTVDALNELTTEDFGSIGIDLDERRKAVHKFLGY
eukprot:SAG31_NODE_4613_length_3097_cov_1.783189_2_plen_171_part_00